MCSFRSSRPGFPSFRLTSFGTLTLTLIDPSSLRHSSCHTRRKMAPSDSRLAPHDQRTFRNGASSRWKKSDNVTVAPQPACEQRFPHVHGLRYCSREMMPRPVIIGYDNLRWTPPSSHPELSLTVSHAGNCSL